MGFFKKKFKPKEELKEALKTYNHARSKVFGMLDDYARSGDADTVAHILEGMPFKAFKHLLEPKWWGTSVVELKKGLTFFQSLLGKLARAHQEKTDGVITAFRQAIINVRAKTEPKPIRVIRKR